jgi:hypothetical protein
MELFISIILAYGITNIIVNGSIFNPVKKSIEKWAVNSNPILQSPLLFLLKMISCMMCLGFWVGLLVGWYYGPLTNIFFNGCFYSGCVWIVNCFVQFLGAGYDPSRTINVQVMDTIKIENPPSNS